MSNKSKRNRPSRRRHNPLLTIARGGPTMPDGVFSTPELRALKSAAEQRGLNPAAVLLETLSAIGDGIGLPIPTEVLGDPDDAARVTHIADQLAAEALERFDP